MAKIHGRNLKVSDDSGIIAASRSCELIIDTDLTAIADPTSGDWTKYRTGKKGWSVSVSGLINVADGISDLAGMAGSEVELEFTNNSGTYAEILTGNAICKSIKLTGTIGNLAQYSATFQGSGVLS